MPLNENYWDKTECSCERYFTKIENAKFSNPPLFFKLRRLSQVIALWVNERYS